MTVIYSSEDVRERLVPTVQEIGELCDHAQIWLRGAGIYGAVLAGSAVTGGATRCSDIDGIAVIDDSSRERKLEGQALLCSVQEQAAAVHVRWDVAISTITLMRTGMHPLGPGYAGVLWRMARSAHGFVGQDPLQLLGPHFITPEHDAQSYVTRKLGKFLQLWCAGLTRESDVLDAYKDILDAPLHAARRILELYDKPTTGSAGEIAAQLEVFLPQQANQLRGLINIKLRYVAGLEYQLHTYCAEEYMALLASVKAGLPTAILFMEALAEHLAAR